MVVNCVYCRAKLNLILVELIEKDDLQSPLILSFVFNDEHGFAGILNIVGCHEGLDVGCAKVD